MFSGKSGAIKLAAIVVIGLVAVKIVVAAITGSISIIAQTVDSFLDLFAVGVSFFAIRTATRPADTEHPFGHGKIEHIAAIIQSFLIFTAAGLIVYSAVNRIQTGTTLELTEVGITAMAISIIASIFLSRHLRKVSRITDSIALEANAQNINADIYSAAAVLAGLRAVRLTGLTIIDPIMAMIVALFIFKIGYDVLKKSFGELVDTRLPEEEEAEIRTCLAGQGCQLVGFHNLRTRKSGSQRHVDLHLVMPKNASVEVSHRICDRLEIDIKSRLPNTSVIIHVEPCTMDYEQCTVSCTIQDEDN